ncbi:MAG: GGDEF domain-containing protein [Burkholderiales bacterium]|nr:GGDEF domain-containing protein [Burkholderiales bacterium]
MAEPFSFYGAIAKEIAQNQRNERRLAVLYIDLDRFKMVNDSYGHSIGDELLREAGERLHGCVYQGDTVARLGGDEFAIIISELDSEQAAQSVAEKIIAVLNEPLFSTTEKCAGRQYRYCYLSTGWRDDCRPDA